MRWLDADRTSAAKSLTAHFDVLEDPQRLLGLADVTGAQAGRFRPSNASGEALSFAFTRSAVWLRVALRNDSDLPLERFLEISYPLLAKLDMHAVSFGMQAGGSSHVAQQHHVGYQRSFAARPHASRFFVFPLVIPPRDHQVVYLRVETVNSLSVPAKLWEPAAFHANEREDYFLQAIYIGIVLTIVLYNLMLFSALRDTSFLVYTGFAVSVALAVLNLAGLSTQYLWPDVPKLTEIGVNVFAALGSVALLLFTRSILGTRQNLPRTDRAMTVLLVLNVVFFLALPVWFHALAPAFGVLNAVGAAFLLGVGLLATWRRQPGAVFFVVAFAAMLVAIVLSQMRNLGFLPTNFFTLQFTQIGSALEMLLLAFALADRYNRMRLERTQAQAQVLAAQAELVDSLKRSEQDLEARVATRTAELQVLNQRLESLSVTDSLTGLANRRQFDAVLVSEWTRAMRSGKPLSVGMLDVDWFKRYNDHYGHQAGDECLRQVAQVLSNCVARTGDLVARYGGEEFVFIAPATGEENAMHMARKISLGMEGAAIRHDLVPAGHVTVSIGVATLHPDTPASAEDLLKAADRALYAAKQQGRSQVVLAPPFLRAQSGA
ncbi:MAG: hypothetical protein RLZZ126_1290 [Pseudomonadota bacterium]